MDSSTNFYGKKQRNPKNQRNKQRVHEAESEIRKEPSRPEASVKGSDPQPQRANRRPRNEQQQPTSNNTSDSTPQLNHDESKENLENVKVDHSYLKKETEEIAKLTKKFTKREITSNWNRYSAPIGVEDTKLEEEAPADFSHLLQVPVSRGGHLQLKEEQEWSAATGSELSGFFALDLQFLSHSLACIPVYERLRLPKHMFTEEEINKFDLEAKCVNHEQIKLNALGVKGNSEKLLKPSIDSENYLNSVLGNSVETIKVTLDSPDIKDSLKKPIDKDTDTNNIKTNTKINNKVEVTPCSESLEFSNLKPETISLKTISDKIEENMIVDSVLNSSIITGKHNDEHNEEEILIEESKSSKQEVHKLPNLDKENEPVTVNFNKEIVSLPKEKRNQQRDGKKSKEENNTDLLKVTKDVKLDDEDDDLDFLLSLRKPTSSDLLVKEVELAQLKDSSFLPGGSVKSASTTPAQPSELDDWLDSVLQE